jgi:hypothetical protein
MRNSPFSALIYRTLMDIICKILFLSYFPLEYPINFRCFTGHQQLKITLPFISLPLSLHLSEECHTVLTQGVPQQLSSLCYYIYVQLKIFYCGNIVLEQSALYYVKMLYNISIQMPLKLNNLWCERACSKNNFSIIQFT